MNSFAAKATRARRLFSTPRGEQAKVSALRITEYLYQEFFRLTGKEGKRSVCWEDGREVGAFNGLLKEVFAALDVDASADAMARKVVDAHRGQHGDD